MRQPLACGLLLGGVLCLHLGAVGAGPADPELEGAEVLPLKGASLRGTLEALTPQVLRLGMAGSGAPSELPLADLREVRVTPAPARPTRNRLRVTLVNGDVLLAESYAPAPDGLELRAVSFGVLTLSLEVLRSLEPLSVRASLCQDEASRLPAQSGSDRLALVGGDLLSGTLLEAGTDGLRIELERGRERVVAWDDLLVAQFDNPAAPPPTGAWTEVETRAGDLLTSAAAPTGDAATGLSVALASDPTRVALVPFSAIRALRWRGGACVDATLLPFTSTYTPVVAHPEGSLTAQFLAHERGARVGRRPRGCPLRLDGTVYAHGFAVHSGSTITLPLAGGFATFEALVGIDDEAEELGMGRVPVAGDVDVRVLGDGRVLWAAKRVAGLEAARRVGPIDVSGVKELVLAVDYGDHEETLDRVTWADPVLLR